jgi:voltage-gated potassium channel
MIAPNKVLYVRRHWITLVAVAMPTLRIVTAFRAFSVIRGFRALRAARSLRLVRLLTSINRNLRAVRAYFGRALTGVLALTAIVVFAGAAGMLNFENPHALQEAGVTGATGLHSYPEALWWTAMIVTTMGSEYWPKTPEGRILCLFLALYAFAVFGYITASLASFLVGKRKPQ